MQGSKPNQSSWHGVAWKVFCHVVILAVLILSWIWASNHNRVDPNWPIGDHIVLHTVQQIGVQNNMWKFFAKDTDTLYEMLYGTVSTDDQAKSQFHGLRDMEIIRYASGCFPDETVKLTENANTKLGYAYTIEPPTGSNGDWNSNQFGESVLYIDCAQYKVHEMIARVLAFYMLAIVAWFSQVFQQDIERSRFSFSVLHVHLHVLFVDRYIILGSIVVWCCAFAFQRQNTLRARPSTHLTSHKKALETGIKHEMTQMVDDSVLQQLHAAKRAGGLV